MINVVANPFAYTPKEATEGLPITKKKKKIKGGFKSQMQQFVMRKPVLKNEVEKIRAAYCLNPKSFGLAINFKVIFIFLISFASTPTVVRFSSMRALTYSIFVFTSVRAEECSSAAPVSLAMDAIVALLTPLPGMIMIRSADF